MEKIKDNYDRNSVNSNIHKSKTKRKKGISDFKLKCWVSMNKNKNPENPNVFFPNNSLAYISTWHAIRHLANTRKKPMLQFEAQLLSKRKYCSPFYRP